VSGTRQLNSLFSRFCSFWNSQGTIHCSSRVVRFGSWGSRLASGGQSWDYSSCYPVAVACAWRWVSSWIYCAVILFYFFSGTICTSLLLSALHNVGLTAFMKQADVLASCGTLGLCLSVTKYVVTFPLQHAIPSCLWRGLLAPWGMTTERAAVCQPPPEPSLEEFPKQQTSLSLTFITWKPYHRWLYTAYHSLNSLQHIKHVAFTHVDQPCEWENPWTFLKVLKWLTVSVHHIVKPGLFQVSSI
jgi:hypothetical protein